jgi:hypothetical protein
MRVNAVYHIGHAAAFGGDTTLVQVFVNGVTLCRGRISECGMRIAECGFRDTA